MRTAGLIGGIGPGSTIEYYRLMVAEYRSRVTDGSYPPILINSIDLTKMLRLIGGGELDSVIDYISGEIRKLTRAGAEVVALASNTPHLVFDQIRLRSPVPMVSIVEAARDAALAAGLKRVGLFGTRFTMEARFYPELFSECGITVIIPEPEDMAYIHEKYMSELVGGIFLPETRDRLLAMADRMRRQHRVEGIILGGTELPLILRDDSGASVPLLDTSAIHVRRIVAEMLT